MTPLPNSPVSECALIAATVFSPAENIAKAMEYQVSPATFYDTRRAKIFSEVVQLHAEGFEPTMDRLYDRVIKSGESFVTMADLSQATSNPPLVVAPICAELKKLETRREVIRQSLVLAEMAGNGDEGIADALMGLLATQTHGRSARSWAEIVTQAEARAQAAISGLTDPDARSLTLGFGPGLDRALKRIRRKEMVVLAARPSVGKSSLMRHVCARNAALGCNVVIQTLEVGCDDVVDQMATAQSGVPLYLLSRAHHRDQEDYRRALLNLKQAPLHCFDSDRTLAAIVARAKAIHAQRPVDLLAIDYLGLVADCKPGRGETVSQAVGQVTKALKRLAMELDCVVLLLAQLNRESAKDNREPKLTDLRDSGDIEQDADRVIFIHRPDENPLTHMSQATTQGAEDLPRFYVQLLQEKGRNVGTAQGALWFHRPLARFELIHANDTIPGNSK